MKLLREQQGALLDARSSQLADQGQRNRNELGSLSLEGLGAAKAATLPTKGQYDYGAINLGD